jgi:hypothetical protein
MAYYKSDEESQARTALTKALSISQTFAGADQAKKALAELGETSLSAPSALPR